MKYIVDLDGQRHVVVLEGGTARLEGEETRVDLADVDGTPVRLVTIGNEVHRVVARRKPGRGAYTLWVDGYRFEADAVDERTRAIRDIAAASAKPSGPSPVVAPMPGLIVRLNIVVGDLVSAGQGLIVMEAMKMENELRASAAGIVRAIFTTVGAAVEKGTVLVELADPPAQ